MRVEKNKFLLIRCHVRYSHQCLLTDTTFRPLSLILKVSENHERPSLCPFIIYFFTTLGNGPFCNYQCAVYSPLVTIRSKCCQELYLLLNIYITNYF
jgi:hypothetical protein